MPKINSLEVVHQDTNKDSYQNLHDILVALNKSLALEKEVVDGDARASIENLLEMYVNDKEAFLRSVQTLTAQFKTSEAKYREEISLLANALSAEAKRTSSLSATVDNANAAIYNESYARATADEALASDLTTVSATVGSKNRTYYQSSAPITSELVSGDLWIDSDDDKLYRYDGSSWNNIQDNAIAANTAAITNEANTRATADSANATAISAVTARLDTGDFATVKTESSTTASKVAGIEAKWGVTTNVNGYVAGIQLLNGGSGSSSFTVAADKFIVKKPDGTNGIVWNGVNSRLDIAGDIYANNLYGTVVNTTNINNNAVTNGASSFSSSSPASVSITTSGGVVYVWAQFLIPDGSYNVYLNRDSTNLKVAGYTLTEGINGVLLARDTPAAGTYSYSITASGSGPVYDITLMVLEVKR